MSAERKENIDEQLKAFARQRRESLGKPVELSPFHRKRLHDEVRCVSDSAKVVGHRRPSWLHALWPRMAFACGVLFLSVTAAIYWLPKKRAPVSDAEKTTLLFMAPPAPAGPVEKPSPLTAALPAAAPASDALNRNGSVDQVPGVHQYGLLRSAQTDSPVPTQLKSETVELKKQSADSIANTTPQFSSAKRGAASSESNVELGAAKPLAKADQGKRLIAAGGGGTRSEVALNEREQLATPPPGEAQVARRARDGSVSSPARAAARPLQETAALKSAEQLSERVDNAAKGQMLSFSQAPTRNNYRQNFNSPPMPPVLQNFKVEQAGPSVRVIDSDGSVYLGNLGAQTEAAAQTPALALADEKRKEVLTRSLQNAQVQNSTQVETSNFRVTGTNRSLNQVVVFTGNITRSVSNSSKDTGQQAANTAIAAENFLLDGKAAVGPKTELSIQATGKPE